MDKKIMIVGTIPANSKDYPEIMIAGPNGTEALHIKIGVVEDVVWRWAVLATEVGHAGAEGDGTTVDYDEPFVMT